MMIAFLIPNKYKDRSLFDAIRNDAFLDTYTEPDVPPPLSQVCDKVHYKKMSSIYLPPRRKKRLLVHPHFEQNTHSSSVWIWPIVSE